MRSANSLSPAQRERLERLQPFIDAEDPIRWQRHQEYARARREARRRELLHRLAIPLVVTLLLLAAAAFAAILISPRDPASPYGDAIGAPERMAAPSQPRANDLRSIARAIALEVGVPPRLFLALIQTESSWRVDARGAAGELGLTQLLPATARRLGVDPHDVRGNLLGGALHLRSHYIRTGDWTRALASYNGRGPKARAYAQRVLRAWESSE
jgi:soluble lytic murein transglycosylase-like protein